MLHKLEKIQNGSKRLKKIKKCPKNVYNYIKFSTGIIQSVVQNGLKFIKWYIMAQYLLDTFSIHFKAISSKYEEWINVWKLSGGLKKKFFYKIWTIFIHKHNI